MSYNERSQESRVDDVDCLMFKKFQQTENEPNSSKNHTDIHNRQTENQVDLTNSKSHPTLNDDHGSQYKISDKENPLPVVSFSLDPSISSWNLDAISVASTSEVNSSDDAASIASRLSQIVMEQEDELNANRTKNHSSADLRLHDNHNEDDEQSWEGQRPRSVSQLPLRCTYSKDSYDGQTLGAQRSQIASPKLRQNKSSNSLHATAHHGSKKSLGGQLGPRRSKEQGKVDICPTGDLQKILPCIQVANYDNIQKPAKLGLKMVEQGERRLEETLEARPRTRSMAERSIWEREALEEDNTRVGMTSTDTNRSQASIGMRRNESAGNFLSERGDFRSLESRGDSNDKQKHQHRGRSHTAEGGQLMLNICRSAWTLHEFEQTFNKQPEKALDVGQSKLVSDCSPFATTIGDHIGGREALAQGDESFGHADSIATIDIDGSQIMAPRAAFERHINNRGSKGASNLLMRASRNALNLHQQRHLNQQQTTNNHIDQLDHQSQHSSMGSTSSLTVPSATNSGANGGSHLKESFQSRKIPSSRRSSHAHSIGSFNSSVDSFPGAILNINRKRRRKMINSGKQLYDSDGDDDGILRRSCCNMATVKQYLPILDWLPRYQWRNYLWGDLMAGLAVAVLNISTSLSAAVVAETDLGAAFRSSIINTFIYALLCSSRHTSFGSWSIMSQMLLVSVRRALSDELILNRINLGSTATWEPEEYEMWHMNIIIMYTFLIGSVQLVSGLLNLGNILASFIPAPLCSSMIAATAITMAIGQLANMCGTNNKILWAIERNTTELWADLKNPPLDITDLFAGLFRWIQQIVLLVRHNEQINMVCVIISIVSVILLALNQYVVQAQLKRLFKRNIFVPSELILLVLMIIVSYHLDLSEKYRVKTCGPIYIDFRAPNLPNLRLFRELWYDSLATALISFTMVFIMAKTYSNKMNYEIDCNQELIACGAGNLVGGLCEALPATASFSRTAGQVEAGGKTQMASFVNCIVLITLAHFLGHHVAALPICVMSATLFYGFIRMATRITEALHFWRLCKVDFAIWVVTFVAILTLDMVNGFLYGFIFSILTMLYRAQNRRCYLLGCIDTSDVYVPLAKYPLAKEIDGIKIFQFCGPIHFVCADLFERLLRRKTRVNVKQLIAETNQEGKLINAENFNPLNMNLPSHIILDFSMISYIDSAGIHVIKKIIDDYNQLNITILLASLASHVAAVVKSEPSLWNCYKQRFYVTLVDAVHCAIRDSQRMRKIAIENNKC